MEVRRMVFAFGAILFFCVLSFSQYLFDWQSLVHLTSSSPPSSPTSSNETQSQINNKSSSHEEGPTFPETKLCKMKSRMAIHILHHISKSNPKKGIMRNAYTQRMITEFCNLPFATVDIYIHTNTRNVSFNGTAGRVCKITVIAYNQAKWWNKTMESLGGPARKGDDGYVLLGWTARQLIAKNALYYDIVMCIENDILVPVRSITHYWCQHGVKALAGRRHLQFVLFDQTPVTPRYPSGLMTYIVQPYTEVGAVNEIPLMRQRKQRYNLRLVYRVNASKETPVGIRLFTWPAEPKVTTDYYIPLWILDKKHMRMALENNNWYLRGQIRTKPGGYKLRTRYMVQEDAFLQITTGMMAYPVVVGVRCPKNHKGSNRSAPRNELEQGCHIHPDAFIHHLPNNYGYNDKFLKQVNPQSVDELYCLRPPCDAITPEALRRHVLRHVPEAFDNRKNETEEKKNYAASQLEEKREPNLPTGQHEIHDFNQIQVEPIV
eukprot:PhF_6_TR12647/c1_g1_i8/m.20071